MLLRALRITGGIGLLLAGTAMLVLPGPGVVTIVAGLAVLSSEWPFAKRVLTKIEQRFPWLFARATSR